MGQRYCKRKHNNLTICRVAALELSWLSEKDRGQLECIQNRKETAARFISRVPTQKLGRQTKQI